MKPAQIRVFDGLRLTSEHLEHLQQAMTSTVQDLRGIAGAARVHQGMDVAVADGKMITVQPGFAFDSQRNRIVIDEPQSLSAEFGQNDSQLYVCAGHQTVEGGEVDTHATIIWDSGAVLVRPTLPEPAENLLPIAKVVRQVGSDFQVVPLSRAPPAVGVSAGEDAKATTESVYRSASTCMGTPRIGLEVLRSDEPGFDLRASLLGRPAAISQWRAVLFEREIEIPQSGRPIHCLVKVALTMRWKDNTSGKPNAAEVRRVLVATAQGEACVPATGAANHVGLTTVRYDAIGTAPPEWSSELTQDGIATIALAPLVADLARSEVVSQALHSLGIAMRLERDDGGRSRVLGMLYCSGDESAGRIEGLERFDMSLIWDARFGWSA